MPPKKKVKTIVINKETNDILEKHFGGEISLLNGTKITKLYDEGILSNQMQKFLKVVKQTYSKSEKGEIELKITYDLKTKKIIIDDDLNAILQEHFDSKIESIKNSILIKLLDEKKITKTQQSTLIKLKKAQKKGELDKVVEYDLKEVEESKESLLAAIKLLESRLDLFRV